MYRVLLVLAAGGLLLSAGLASARDSRPPLAARAARAETQSPRPAVDPNSTYAKAQAAIAQGFAPIDTDRLGRGFNR